MASAYEKERLKFKKEHKELIDENKRLQGVEKEYKLLKIKFDEVSRENEMLKESVSKLLDLCNLSENELEILKSGANIANVFSRFSSLGVDSLGINELFKM